MFDEPLGEIQGHHKFDLAAQPSSDSTQQSALGRVRVKLPWWAPVGHVVASPSSSSGPEDLEQDLVSLEGSIS